MRPRFRTRYDQAGTRGLAPAGLEYARFLVKGITNTMGRHPAEGTP